MIAGFWANSNKAWQTAHIGFLFFKKYSTILITFLLHLRYSDALPPGKYNPAYSSTFTSSKDLFNLKQWPWVSPKIDILIWNLGQLFELFDLLFYQVIQHLLDSYIFEELEQEPLLHNLLQSLQLWLRFFWILFLYIIYLVNQFYYFLLYFNIIFFV